MSEKEKVYEENIEQTPRKTTLSSHAKTVSYNHISATDLSGPLTALVASPQALRLCVSNCEGTKYSNYLLLFHGLGKWRHTFNL
jgi:hypothetical protein